MCRIVIADEKALNRELLRKVAARINGVEIVGEAGESRKVIDLSFALKPDMVFIDNDIGEEAAFEAARRIKGDNPGIYVIILTEKGLLNHSSMDYHYVDEYLQKPVSSLKLSQTIRNFIYTMDSKTRTATHLDSPAGNRLSTYYKQNGHVKKTQLSKEIANALIYIDSHYRMNLSLDTVADRVFLSSYYFSRLFKKEVGINFSNYLIKKKLDEAKHLLETTNKSILEISTHLSFKEQNYFSKVFKKNVGVTPTEYRNAVLSKGKSGGSLDSYRVDPV